MLGAGTVITCASGESVTIERAFTPGGQGCAYAVRRSRTGAPAVLKLFHDRFDRVETQRRLEYLIAQRLGKVCPVLVGPRDLVVSPAGVGYVADLFPGEPLEEVLARPGLRLSRPTVADRHTRRPQALPRPLRPRRDATAPRVPHRPAPP